MADSSGSFAAKTPLEAAGPKSMLVESDHGAASTSSVESLLARSAIEKKAKHGRTQNGAYQAGFEAKAE
jgi:hypothetical protein